MHIDLTPSSFICIYCRKTVSQVASGTSHRNHCPSCLWSKHVDKEQPGDRVSLCNGPMQPIGLTFKHEGMDKYGKQKQGEIMVVHLCTQCGKLNINRIAGDDDEKVILSLISQAGILKEIQQSLQAANITLLEKTDEPQVQRQLFGI